MDFPGRGQHGRLATDLLLGSRRHRVADSFVEMVHAMVRAPHGMTDAFSLRRYRSLQRGCSFFVSLQQGLHAASFARSNPGSMLRSRNSHAIYVRAGAHTSYSCLRAGAQTSHSFASERARTHIACCSTHIAFSPPSGRARTYVCAHSWYTHAHTHCQP